MRASVIGLAIARPSAPPPHLRPGDGWVVPSPGEQMSARATLGLSAQTGNTLQRPMCAQRLTGRVANA